MPSFAAEQVRQQIALRRQVEVVRPRRRIPRLLEPAGIRRDYERALRRMVDRLRAFVQPDIDAMRPILERARSERRDGPGDDALELIESLRRRLANVISLEDAKRLGQQVAQRTAAFHSQVFQRQVRAGLGVDVLIPDSGITNVTEAFAAENAALIRDIPAELAAKIAKASTRAVAEGKLHGEFAKEIEGAFGFEKKRAKRIARDQVGKLYGQINATRQRNMGIGRFVWRTVNDRRVRGTPGGAFPNAKPSHYALEGKTFSYPDGAPGVGLPGEPINCRCWAEGVMEDLL